MKIGNPFTIKEISIVGSKDAVATEQPLSAERQPAFVPGQLFKARIIGSAPDGKIKLEINGQAMTARADLPLKAGTELWLEVRASDKTVWFAPAGKKGAVLDLLRQLLTDGPAPGRALQALETLDEKSAALLPPEARHILQQMSGHAAGRNADAEAVVRLLSWLRGGQESAAGPRLFKGRLDEQLLEITTLLHREMEQAGLHSAALADVKKLAALLSAQHHLNSQPPLPHQQMFLLFPCFFAGGQGWGEWLFSFEGQGRQDGQAQGDSYSLSFFLEMCRIGGLHLQARINGKAVQGIFSVTSEAARQHLDNSLPELQEVLETLGYEPVALACRVSRKNTIQMLKAELAEKVRLRSVNILDITA